MNEFKFRLFLLTFTAVLFTVGFTPLVTQNVFAAVPGASICSSHCNENTLGVDSKGNRIVSNGISYNGYSADVERYYTPYPLITVNVGETNKADFKIYDSLGPKTLDTLHLHLDLIQTK